MLKVLAVIVIVKAFLEVNLMQDPQIFSFPTSLSPSDREELGEVNFAEYEFGLAFLMVVFPRDG